MQKLRIKEIIVVEGKDDISAVKQAVDADLIPVHGYAVKRKSTLEKIKTASERVGVIVLTDPDFAGKMIRKTIEDYVPNVKHAYISREEGTLKDNIGVENAKPEAIISALKKARFKNLEKTKYIFDTNDMLYYGLVGFPNSKSLRQTVGSYLKIGYSNAKQFLSTLNSFDITKEELEEAINKTK